MKRKVLKTLSCLLAGLMAVMLAAAIVQLPAQAEGRDTSIFNFERRSIKLKPGEETTIYIDATEQFRYFVVGMQSEDSYVTSNAALGDCYFTIHLAEDESANVIHVYFYMLDNDDWYDTVTITVDHSTPAEDTTTDTAATTVTGMVDLTSAPVLIGDTYGTAEVLMGGQIVYVKDTAGYGVAIMGIVSNTTGAYQQVVILGEDISGYLYVSLPYTASDESLSVVISDTDRQNLKSAGINGIRIVTLGQTIGL